MENFESSAHSPTLHHLNALDRLEEKELQQSERAILDRTVWRKLDITILPVCIGFYLFDVLDKGNVGNARVAGLQTSLSMSNYQYTMALVATYVLSMAIQFPCNMLVKSVGPNIILPAMITVGGFVSASQGLVHNYSGFLACRSSLGFFQGGIFSMIVLCLSFFYPPKLLQRRIAAFFSISLLAAAFAGLIAAAIVHIDGVGGKPGWAWIFIIEGLFAALFGAISFFFLPRSPERARFLTETERAYVISTLAHARAGLVSENDKKDKFSWTEVSKAVTSPHVWFLAVVFFFNGTMQCGLAVFLPTIVTGLGYAGSQAQLVTAPPLAAAFVCIIVAVIVSDHYQRRSYIVIFFALFKIIGFTVYLVSSSNHVGYASLFFSVPGAFSETPILLAWLVNNSAPHTRRATAVAITFMSRELGGLFSLFLFGYLSTDTKHAKAAATFIVMSIGILLASMANWVYLSRENLLKAERRLRMREEDELEDAGDRSAWFTYDL